MLEIRELNWQDADTIYQVLKELPADENGFMNPVLWDRQRNIHA